MRVRWPTDYVACWLDGAYGALRRWAALHAAAGGSTFSAFSVLSSCGPSALVYLHRLTGVLSGICAGTPLPLLFVYMHVMLVCFLSCCPSFSTALDGARFDDVLDGVGAWWTTSTVICTGFVVTRQVSAWWWCALSWLSLSLTLSLSSLTLSLSLSAQCAVRSM